MIGFGGQKLREDKAGARRIENRRSGELKPCMGDSAGVKPRKLLRQDRIDASAFGQARMGTLTPSFVKPASGILQ